MAKAGFPYDLNYQIHYQLKQETFYPKDEELIRKIQLEAYSRLIAKLGHDNIRGFFLYQDPESHILSDYLFLVDRFKKDFPSTEYQAIHLSNLIEDHCQKSE